MGCLLPRDRSFRALALLASIPFLVAAHAASGAERIVSAGGAATEIVYALGAQDQLVGVDATSLHPPQALTEKPRVGYMRALSPEGVLSLKPTVLLATSHAGPPDVLRLIEGAGVRIVAVPDGWSPEGIDAKIRLIGDVVGKPAEAERLARETAQALADLVAVGATMTSRKRVLFLLSLQNGRPMVGGVRTAADALIRLAGGINAMGDVDGYKPVSEEALLSAAPDLILVMDRAGAGEDMNAIRTHPAILRTPAGQTGQIVSMDGLYMLGFGPRTPDAVREVMLLLYAEKKADLAARTGAAAPSRP